MVRIALDPYLNTFVHFEHDAYAEDTVPLELYNRYIQALNKLDELHQEIENYLDNNGGK